jgi:RNA polymerase sigma factor (sigma-70 family)
LPSIPLTETTSVGTSCATDPADVIPALTARLARGEEAAYCEFHVRYFARLYRFLLVICRGQEEQAKEALQQTLLRVARYAKAFPSEEVFWSWLTTLARSAARDAGRRERRYADLLRRFATMWWAYPSCQSNQEEDRLGDLIREALEELPAEERRIIAGKYLSGESIRELAAQSGLSEKAVESRLSRARVALRELVVKKLRVL